MTNKLHSFSGPKNIASSDFGFLWLQITAEISKIKIHTERALSFTFNVLAKYVNFQDMSIFWCKNVSCTRYEMFLLTEKNMCNYSRFSQGLMWYS